MTHDYKKYGGIMDTQSAIRLMLESFDSMQRSEMSSSVYLLFQPKQKNEVQKHRYIY
jgi:hypothetical protein